MEYLFKAKYPTFNFITLAEEVGFEPTVLSYNGFQDRRLKPLGHSSEVFLLPLENAIVNNMKYCLDIRYKDR